MKLNRQQIQERAITMLETHLEGTRCEPFLRAVKLDAPDTPHHSVHGGVHTFLASRAAEILKAARGTYQLAKFVAADDAIAKEQAETTVATPVRAEAAAGESVTEQDFYTSFARRLEENDEVTVASALGGSSLGGKWGTPDVIGVLKARAQDMFKFES